MKMNPVFIPFSCLHPRPRALTLALPPPPRLLSPAPPANPRPPSIRGAHFFLKLESAAAIYAELHFNFSPPSFTTDNRVGGGGGEGATRLTASPSPPKPPLPGGERRLGGRAASPPPPSRRYLPHHGHPRHPFGLRRGGRRPFGSPRGAGNRVGVRA